MIGHLHKKGMKGDFIFLEKVKPGTQFDKRTLDSLDYAAYIIYNPFDSADLEMNRAKKNYLIGNAYVFGVSPNTYQQKFSVQIYNKTDKSKPVWERLLQFNFDPTEKDQYNEISYLVLNYLPFA